MTSKCAVCSGSDILSFLKRERVPVHQHLVSKDRASAQDMDRAQLDMVVCRSCGFVFNRLFDFSKLSYDESYDNTQSCSAHFNTYLDSLVAYLVEQKNVRNCTIVEVGCGKGIFLRKLVEYPGANNRGIGFDPSYVGPESEMDERLVFHRKFYDESSAGLEADVVVCRHVIEHVPEPLLLLRTVRAALEGSPNARVYFETPCVDWILKNKVVWDFFYEHCSLFTAHSLALAFSESGFDVQDVHHVFDEQYLWLEARPGRTAIGKGKIGNDGAVENTVRLSVDYGEQEETNRLKWLAYLSELKTEGALALWGAGAKGVTFANLVDPDATLIDCVVDLNPNKQAGFLPGTGHPVVSPLELRTRNVKNAVLMNPNYRQENLTLLEESGIAVKLVELAGV